MAGEAPHDPDSDHLPADVDWLVLDRTTHAPGSREEQLLDELLFGGEFEVVSEDQSILVARRVADEPTRAPSPTPATTSTTGP